MDQRVHQKPWQRLFERLLCDFLSDRRVAARSEKISALLVTIILDGVRRR